MPAWSRIVLAVTLGVVIPLASTARAEGIDTEHLFGFMIGSDVGNVGEREFQSQSTGRFGKGGRYRNGEQEFEVEFVPAANVRIEIGSSFAVHDIRNVAGLDDRRQMSWRRMTATDPGLRSIAGQAR